MSNRDIKKRICTRCGSVRKRGAGRCLLSLGVGLGKCQGHLRVVANNRNIKRLGDLK